MIELTGKRTELLSRIPLRRIYILHGIFFTIQRRAYQLALRMSILSYHCKGEY